MPTLRTSDAELFYEEAGRGDPVVLLHGLGSSTRDWAPQIAALSQRYRVIAIDMRGSGRSRGARPFSVARFADDTAAVIDHLHAAPAHVIGLSMGGMVAFQLAIDQPHAVHTLTIINSGPAVVPRTARERAAIVLRQIIARVFGPVAMAKLLAPRLFPRPDQASLRARFVERMADNDRRAYAATQRALVGFDVSSQITTIDVPALIVASDGDYTPVARKEDYARRMPHARVVTVADSRHALPIEEPDKLQPILDQFLAAHAMSGGEHAASR